jgi:Fe2+ or Zn2+ uptake regulation protein
MEKIKKILIKKRYKLTKPRIAILNFLFKANNPYSAKEISKKLKNVDLVSIYRNLALFSKLNLINEEFFEKEKKYCLAIHPHHHIICRKCGKIEKIICNHNFYNKFKNYSDIKHQLILTGICSKCKL